MDLDSERVSHLADILLGAAYADGRKDGSEETRLRALLAELLETHVLPATLDARLRTFDPARFDLLAAAAAFVDDPPAHKRKLLELVAAVGDADDVLDVREDDYLVRVADAIGAERATYDDLVLGVEELREAFQTVCEPPPFPKG